MKQYQKIQTMFKRDGKTLLLGEWSTPELEYLSNLQWEWTEKIDGTNVRILFDGKVGIRGKTDNVQMPPHLWKFLHEKFTDKLMNAIVYRAMDKDEFENSQLPSICLYGEGYGEKIRKGGNYGPVNFILFDVWIDGWWLKREDLIDIAKKLGISVVPIVGCGTLMEAIEFVKTGFTSVCAETSCIAEGLVLKPLVQLFNRKGERIITKIKSKDFKSVKGEVNAKDDM